MPFQWKNGTPPPGVKTSKVLVIGPDEMYESDYPLVKKYLDQFTLRMENVAIVLLGDGVLPPKDRQGVRRGTDYLALKWADYYKWTRVLLPEKNYGFVPKERDKDLVKVLGNKSWCLWFRDQNAHEWLYERVLSKVIKPKRLKVVKV